MSVNGIKQLAAGRLSQKNIFVKPGCTHRGGTEEFVVILPGCRVTAEKLPSDSYKLLHFQADLNYGELIEQGQAPGLYEVKHHKNRWRATPRRDGRIEKRTQRTVAISDSRYDGYPEAARSVGEHISGGGLVAGMAGARTVKSSGEGGGFDLHFTPGKKRVGGFENYRNAVNPLNDGRLHESALLLARTMYMARDIESVCWIAEFGGSGVLTQALRILSDRKVKLNKHVAFLFRPSTSPHEALKAMHAVEELELNRNFKESNALDYIGNRDNLRIIRERWKREGESYSALHRATDYVCAGVTLHNTLGFVVGAAGLAGLSIGAPAVGAFLTALGSAVATAATAGKLGQQAMKAWAPKKYNEIASKF